MMKRRMYKRPWQKFHEIQESFRENARLRPSENSKNKDAEKVSDTSNQHSPELVLYESNPCLCSGKLSPEIILKRPETRLQTESDKDVIEDVIVAGRIERSSLSREYHESNLLMCDFNIEPRDDFANLENCYPKRDTTIVDDPLDLTDSIHSCSFSSLNNVLNSDATDIMHDGQSSADAPQETTRQRISQSTTFPSNLESQSREDSVPEPANLHDKYERRSLEENSNQQKNRDIPGTMDNFYSLDKTFSMNDDLMREMDNYLDGQSSMMNANQQSTTETTCKLQKEYISESARFAIFHEIEKRSGFTDDIGLLSSDELAGLSVCRSTEDHDDSRDNKKRRKGTPNDNKRFVLEKIGERLTANWSEFRRKFAYLQRVSKKIRGEDSSERSASLLYRIFPYVSDSTSSSSFRTPSNRDVATRFTSEGREFIKDEEEEAKRIESKIRPETNSCGESLQSPKSFRNATSTFDYEGEVKKQKQSEIRPEITDSLPRKSEECLLDPPSCGKTHWDNILESTLDLSTIFNYDNRSIFLQKVIFYSCIL